MRIAVVAIILATLQGCAPIVVAGLAMNGAGAQPVAHTSAEAGKW